MPQPSKPQLALYAAFAVAVLLIGGRFLRSGAGDAAGASGGAGAPAVGAAAGAGTAASAGGTTTAADPSAAGSQLVVDVKGAVRRPGVYRLPAGARALDAVRRAGGITHRADRVGVNLAARVVDGGEVVVPERAGARGGGAAASAGGRSAGGTSSAGASGDPSTPLSLDLNTATVDELQQLDGVGPATAAKIVAYRTQHGGFASIDELDAVPGIGPAKLAAIRAQLGR